MQAPSPQTLAATEKALVDLGKPSRVLTEQERQELRSNSLAYYEQHFSADKALELTQIYSPKNG